MYLFILFPLVSFSQASDSIGAFQHYRKTLVSQLLSNPRSPLDSQSIFGLRYFAENDSFRCPTVILPLAENNVVEFATSDGNTKEYRPYAKIFFRFRESMHELTVYESLAHSNHPLYKNKLFLPFWDETNGFESYGGGRYLDINKTDVDNRTLILDFNKAYNPWCAYGDGFSCPIPPPQNRLPIFIRAGEGAFQAMESKTSPKKASTQMPVSNSANNTTPAIQPYLPADSKLEPNRGE